MTPLQLLWVAAGGALGAVARVLLTQAFPVGRLPWGTLAVNVIGSCAIGWLLARLGGFTPENTRSHAVLVAGFCGGFTTFSTFSWQVVDQLRQGHIWMAVVHATVAVVACVAATGLGWRLGK